MWKNIKVVRQIGKGTTGKIYRCIDLNYNMPVAIKVENIVQNKSHLYDEFKMLKYLNNVGKFILPNEINVIIQFYIIIK